MKHTFQRLNHYKVKKKGIKNNRIPSKYYLVHNDKPTIWVLLELFSNECIFSIYPTYIIYLDQNNVMIIILLNIRENI